MELHELIPDANILAELPAEELGGYILLVMNSRIENRGQENSFHPQQFPDPAIINRVYPSSMRMPIHIAIMEAWNWLENTGLLVAKLDQPATWFFVSRRGRELKDKTSLANYQKVAGFPRELLHARIADKAYMSFLRGDFDTAVFQAFKEVEVMVRERSRLGAKDIGVDLMRRAFHADTGPLTDLSSERAERESLAHLFAGAIGSYKNPHSHRTVTIKDPSDAIEMLILASHLYGIALTRPITKVV